jgi:uncharacterized protein YqgC (DUF456 family)
MDVGRLSARIGLGLVSYCREWEIYCDQPGRVQSGAMAWVWYLILSLVLIGGLYINLIGAPGLWVMVLATAVYAWATHFAYAAGRTLLTIVLLALAAEVVEFIVAGRGARKAGASRAGVWGAIIGSIVGGILFTGIIIFPIISTIFGVCLGAFLGAIVGEVLAGSNAGQSLRVGWGAAKGRLMAIFTKLAFGCAILVVALIACRPPISWHWGKNPSPSGASSRVLAPGDAFI